MCSLKLKPKNMAQFEITFEAYEVEFDYSFTAGKHTLSNGDPGYPDDEELEIVKVTIQGVEVDFDDLSTQLQEGIKTKAREHGKDSQ